MSSRPRARIQTGGLATNREGAFPVSIIGIEPQVEASINLIAENIADGRYLAREDGDSVLVGRALADVMQAGVGDRFTLVGSDVHKQNRQRSMTIVGIYDIGVSETEKKTLYISLGEAQSLYGLPGQSTEIDINLKRLGQESAVVPVLSAALPGSRGRELGPQLPRAADRRRQQRRGHEHLQRHHHAHGRHRHPEPAADGRLRAHA